MGMIEYRLHTALSVKHSSSKDRADSIARAVFWHFTVNPEYTVGFLRANIPSDDIGPVGKRLLSLMLKRIDLPISLAKSIPMLTKEVKVPTDQLTELMTNLFPELRVPPTTPLVSTDTATQDR